MTTAPLACDGGLAPTRQQQQLGANTVSYLEWGGGGPTLLLLHGITSSARGWWRVAPQLVGLGYHVYAMDLPGHGQSDLIAEHTIPAIADLVARLLDALEANAPTLIGHSWGGAVALTLAAATPVSRLVLVDPLLAMAPAAGESRLPSFLEGLGDAPEQTLPRLRAANPDWHECDLFWKGEALQQCRAAAVRGLFLESGEWSLTPLFAKLAAPTLMLLADTQYSVVAPALLAEVEQMLRPGMTELRRIAGTNHNMQRGGFTPTMEALLSWLQQ